MRRSLNSIVVTLSFHAEQKRALLTILRPLSEGLYRDKLATQALGVLPWSMEGTATTERLSWYAGGAALSCSWWCVDARASRAPAANVNGLRLLNDQAERLGRSVP